MPVKKNRMQLNRAAFCFVMQNAVTLQVTAMQEASRRVAASMCTGAYAADNAPSTNGRDMNAKGVDPFIV